MMRRLSLLFLGALVASGPSAMAATRVVPFVGMYSLEMQTPRLHALNGVSFCHVAVVNVGATRQNGITITGFGITGDDGCSGATLNAGTSCYASFQVTSALDSSRLGICSGTITVSDQDNMAPGAVAATGSMTVFQEAMVVGGVLSGAYYASGNVVTPTAGTNDLSGSMNLYCTEACRNNTASPGATRARVCKTLCGVMEQNTPYYPPNPTNIAGVIDSNQAADASVSTVDSVPSSVYHYAPSYYAGGSVYEIEIGALDAVCNGNPTFVSDDYSGVPHSHAGGSAQAGQEVLFCGHRHNLPDLYLKVGQTIPIVINGGSAF